MDREVLVATFVAGFDVDILRWFQTFIHESTFKSTRMYPFLCCIFNLCRSTGVPIWHIDIPRTPTGTDDIGLIWDEVNEVAPHRRLKVYVQPLGENLADTVKQARWANKST